MLNDIVNACGMGFLTTMFCMGGSLILPWVLDALRNMIRTWLK